MKKVKNPRKDIFDNESPKYRFQISIIASEDVESTVEKFFRKNYSSFRAAGYLRTVGSHPGSKTIKIHEKKIKLILLLHSSDEEFLWLVKKSVKRSKALILIYNSSDTKSLNKMLEWSQMIKEINNDILVVLVGNTFDLEENREISQDRIEKVKENYEISLLMEISLKTGENVEEMFRNVTNMLLKNYNLSN